MPQRSYNTSEYRFGFNGMEKDDEVKGVGNSYATEFRQLDTRLGRWLSIDPKSRDFADRSTYQMVGNNPIRVVDPIGNTDYIFDSKGNLINISYTNNKDRYFTQSSVESYTHTKSIQNKETMYLNIVKKPDFQVIQIINDASSSIGHTGIGFDGKVKGFYPTDVNQDRAYTKVDLHDSPLQIHTDELKTFQANNKKSDIFFIKVTNEQKNALVNALESKENNIRLSIEKGEPILYELFSNNCTTNACDALKAANIYNGEQVDGLIRPGNMERLMNSENSGKLLGKDPGQTFIEPNSTKGQKKR